jgi:hypothetical protein
MAKSARFIATATVLGGYFSTWIRSAYQVLARGDANLFLVLPLLTMAVAGANGSFAYHQEQVRVAPRQHLVGGNHADQDDERGGLHQPARRRSSPTGWRRAG